MKIHYVTGSRADFGLMEATLKAILEQPDFDIGIVATGQHTAGGYGDTLTDIKASGLPLIHTIPVVLSGAGGAEMALANARELEGFVQYWQSNKPDLVLLLGDRGEMLMGAFAACHLGIHVGHFHGGERSGTIDESLRHAISKMSHFHFPASENSRERLINMGERPEYIWTVGAPGLVDMLKGVEAKDGWMQKKFNISKKETDILLVFHPVVQEADQAYDQIRSLMDVLVKLDCGGVVLRPNSDAGGKEINRFLDDLDVKDRFTIIDHLPRDDYRMVLANVDLLVGNTSSGIVESASFGVPFLNLGARQQGRLRNKNVVDCADFDRSSIETSFHQALSLTGPFENLYGDGKVPSRLLPILRSLPLDSAVLSKLNSY